MTAKDILAGLPGLYLLTASGELGYYDEQGRLQIDAELSQALAAHNREFLRTYLKDPEAARLRLGVVYEAARARAFGRTTLHLEPFVVRELYPVGGRPTDALTVFQQKNREQGVTRGVDLLLDARSELAARAPIYCPVLFDRHTTVAEYADGFGRALEPGELAAPALELLNLVATLPIARRETAPLLALKARLRRSPGPADDARASGLTLVAGGIAWDGGRAGAEAYADVARDKRLARGVTLAAADLPVPPPQAQVAHIERWLEIPHRRVDAGILRRFAQFRELDEHALAVLAERSYVYTAPAGTRLLERGAADAWNMYLLEGELMLTAADGPALRVAGGSARAAHPVAFLKPRKYAVETLSPVSFLWVHDLLLQSLLATEWAPPAAAPGVPALRLAS
jgi:hypothetical protein